MGAAWLIGACSNVIGLSDYDIVTSPDSGGSMNEGGQPQTNGGKKGGGGSDQGGSTHAGSDAGGTDAGADNGGSSNGGSNTAGTSAGGTDTAGGEGGSSTGGTATGGSAGTAGTGGNAGSGGTGGCKSSLDCNDTIACTKDACGPGGVCTHTPDDTKCDSTRCEVCSVGIGCVAGPTEVTQLLIDPAFDLGSTEWDQTSDRFGKNIFADGGAQTPGNVAKFGPAAANATAQEYGDLLQFVTIPADVVGLTLKGYYKLTPGAATTGMKVPKNDYVAIGFWDPASSSIMPVEQFDAIHGDSGAQASWKAFSYSLSAVEVATLAGNEYTFDLVANTWDSTFRFDTLELNATTCK